MELLLFYFAVLLLLFASGPGVLTNLYFSFLAFLLFYYCSIWEPVFEWKLSNLRFSVFGHKNQILGREPGHGFGTFRESY